MTDCSDARLYAGAVADGELEAVPDIVRRHIQGCAACRRDVDTQREIQRSLVSALRPEYASAGTGAVLQLGRAGRPRVLPALPRLPLSWVRGAAVAAVLVLAVGGGLLLPAALRPAPVTSAPLTDSAAMAGAVHAYGEAVDFTSTDPVSLANWSATHGSPVKVMAIAGEVPVGARMRMVSGSRQVTIVYAGGTGAVEMSAVPAALATGWPSMEARTMSGRAVGMMHQQGVAWIIVAPSEADLIRTMSTMPGGASS